MDGGTRPGPIVSAGSVASPQILELSGIGQPELLKQHGIEVKHELPAVGENFRDHIAGSHHMEGEGSQEPPTTTWHAAWGL